MTAGAITSAPRPLALGRPFVDPVFDFAVIGGGLSLITFFALWATGTLHDSPFSTASIPWILLAANACHFAATTVRLYTKPGAFQDLPFFTLTLPLVMLAVLTLAVASANLVGMYLFGLYLTLSPYHYASQTYGLAAMYAIRSGRRLDDRDQRLLWWVCMLPFAYAVANGKSAGLGWLLPPPWLADPSVAHGVRTLADLLGAATFVAPVGLLVVTWRRTGVTLPAISWLLLVTNGMWWIVFDYLDAFIWGAIFHSIQYLGIVMVFHVRDHAPRVRRRGDWLAPALRFYAACLVLGYALFEVLPYAYVAVGFTLAQSSLLCTAMINFHHFIVDRVIWRVRRDPNLQVVIGAR